ncbi:bifunctional DNA primase/polymerase [Vulcanisaeta distributa]|uniref:bifunctional DNA primase/polymerase n=1 Tax=Vulcanisaeta distributa TaxID=164451 RepID=UPI0006D0FDA5|nr:bifunctional DNA primase/polymerase [Vulcanisaeta distributa]
MTAVRAIGLSIEETARLLVHAGYNVIFVNESKMPIGIEEYAKYYDEHMTEDFINEYVKKALRRAKGIALLGNINPWFPPDKRLVIIDVDNPWTWDDVKQRLPQELANKIEGSWKWLTGPRCPIDRDKHGIKCDGEVCTHEMGNEPHSFKLPEARRGLAYAVLVPGNCVGLSEGTKKLMGGDIELRLRGGYELIPPSLHPSGINYEWSNPAIVNGLVVPPSELTCDEWRTLLNALGYGKESKQQEVTQQTGGLGTRRCREEVIIPEDRIAQAVQMFKDVYVPNFRDHMLFGILGMLWWRCVSYESARKFVDMLTTWAQQQYPDENVKKDYYILDWVYGRAGGSDEDKRRWGGKPKFYEHLIELFKSRGGLSEEEAIAKAEAFIGELLNALGISSGVRRPLACEGASFTACLKRIVRYDGNVRVDCKVSICGIENDDHIEVKKVTHNEDFDVEEILCTLPKTIVWFNEKFTGNAYIVFVDKRGRIHIVDDVNNLVNELRNSGYIIERLSNEVQQAIEKMMIKEEGYLTPPGITEDGVIDPTLRLAELLGLDKSRLKPPLDLNDYGIESLAVIHDFIMSHYPGNNKWRALANVAFVLGKIVSPYVRKFNRTFIDSLIWNYGRGGEGKTSLVEYIMMPLLGITDEFNEMYFVVLKGSVRTYQQFRNLISLNRLPLILDEQTEKELTSNEEFIIEATIGFGIIGVHAARYGPGIGAFFRSNRGGIIVFTNVQFSKFLRKVQARATEFAFARRVVTINWEHEPLNASTDELIDLASRVKPIYGGAINRVWPKYRDELIKSRDIYELSKKLLLALGREYAMGDEGAGQSH